jgi:hypothetical protein
MAHPNYLRKIVKTGKIERVPFSAEHYQRAGFSGILLSGMPLLEAHQIINHWNVNQLKQEYVYGLDVDVPVSVGVSCFK